MLILKQNQKLQILLAGAVSSTELPINVGFDEFSNALAIPVPGGNPTVTTGGTAVDVVAAPAPGLRRKIREVSVYNADNAAATVTVRVNDNGTARIVLAFSLAVGESLFYSESRGWYVLTTTGAQKSTASTDSSAALSTAVSAGLTDSVTRSHAASAATSNGLGTSSAQSSATSTGLADSQSKSSAVSAGLAASTAQSAGVLGSTSASVARSSITSGTV